MNKLRIYYYLDKLFKDNNGKTVVWQAPNLPLWGWFAFLALSKLVNKGWLHLISKYLSLAFLIIWAIMEITKGRSKFRRLLGLVVLAWSIIPRL